jgi:hypothetical protein
MASLTATITNIASGPFNVLTLFNGTTPAGITLSPATPPRAPKIAAHLSIQSDPSNSGVTVYTGDQNLPATGTAYGEKLAAGAVDLREPVGGTALTGVYINASANGAVVNINAYGGFQ